MATKVIPPFIIIPKFLTKTECNNIIKLGNKKPAKLEQFGEDEGRYSHATEFTPCMFNNPEEEYGNRIHKRLIEINDTIYGYKLNMKKWLHGSFLRYDKDGFTNWHYDGYFGTEYPERKLTGVVMLSEGGKDYAGGDFEFPFYMNLTPKQQLQMKQKGTLIVFPSSSFHRVTTVTDGTRYSLGFFMPGPLFK